MYNSFCGNMFSFFLGRCLRVITVGSFKCVFNFKKLPSYNTSKVVKTFYMRIRDTGRPATPHPELGSQQMGSPLSLESSCPIPVPRLHMRATAPVPWLSTSRGLRTAVCHARGVPCLPTAWLPTAYAPGPRDAHELWPRPWLCGGERAVSDTFGSGDWDDRQVRHALSRKVHTVMSIQLLVTVAIMAVFTFVKPVGDFVRANVAVCYASYAVFLVTYLTLACSQTPRRRFPWNIIRLTLSLLPWAT